MKTRIIMIGLLLALAVSPAFATWGGITLDWNYSYGKAYCYPGISPELWIPLGGSATWQTNYLQFTAPASQGYFMFDMNVNQGDILWIDNVQVINAATGAQLLNDPGFESGGNGFFPWEIEPAPATGGYTPGEGVGGSQCIKFVGVGTGHTNFSKILQYDGWGTGTLPIVAGQTYFLQYDYKTASIVPEPGTIASLLSGLAGFGLLIRRKRA